MKRLTIVIIAISSMLISVGCSAQLPEPSETPSPSPTQTPTPEAAKEHFLAISTTIDGNKLVIHGETNIPDDSWLAVHIDRLYKCEGDTEWNTVSLAAHTVIVEDGKYSDTAVIYEEKWYADLSKQFREVGIPPISEVSDQLSITVILSPLRFPQPNSVSEIVGEKGENLKGEQVRPVEHLGDTFYVLSANEMVDFPFNR